MEAQRPRSDYDAPPQYPEVPAGPLGPSEVVKNGIMQTEEELRQQRQPSIMSNLSMDDIEAAETLNSLQKSA